jgi:ribokinase
MKAVSIGGATVDAFATIENDSIERMTMLNAETSFLLLEEGRKTEAVDISTHCGGGAVNAAVALARLGFDVAALVKLGRDARAELILSRLQAEGISTGWVVRDASARTGASVILSSHERNASVFTFRGANALLEPGDVNAEALACDLAYVSGLSGKSTACFPLIVERAKASGALVAVNATIRQLSAHPETLIDNLHLIDILALNRREAEALLPALVVRAGHSGPLPRVAAGDHIPALLTRGLVAGSFEIGLPAFFGALLALGTRYVMLTDGSRGAFVCAGREIIYCPAEPTVVASTTGAGDAMGATFAAFLAMGYGGEVALKAATLNAASVVAYIDTQSGLLELSELEARLDAHAEKPRKWKI